MRRAVQVAAVSLFIAATGFAAWRLVVIRQRAEIPPALVGVVHGDPRSLTEFRLHDHTGASFDRERLRGHWTLLFFGYTSCPDICPTTMLVLRSVQAELRRRGEALPTVVFVSADPARDDLARLHSYVAYFAPEFVGVTGEDEQLRALALGVGAMYERDPPGPGGDYAIAHSASIFLVDPRGRAHATFSPPHQPDDIAAKLATISARYAQQ